MSHTPHTIEQKKRLRLFKRNPHHAWSIQAFKRIQREKGKYNDYLSIGLSVTEKELFGTRLPMLDEQFYGNWFQSLAHQSRFERACRLLRINITDGPPRYLSVLFLISAETALWNLCEPHLYHSSLDFDNLQLQPLSIQEYSYYLLAKGFHFGIDLISLDDISDDTLVDDTTFTILIHAKLIAKYGGGILRTKH